MDSNNNDLNEAILDKLTKTCRCRVISRAKIKEAIKNGADTFEKVKDFLFNEFNKEYDSQLISMCTKEIQHRLKCYTKPKKNNVDSLKQQLNSVVSSIKIEDIYNKRKNEVDAEQLCISWI